MSLRNLCLGVVVACLASAGPVGAQQQDVAVFANPGGCSAANPGEIELDTLPASLVLCIEITPHSPSAGGSGVCRNDVGTVGSEICGYHVSFRVEGDGYIDAFAPIGGLRFWPESFGPGVQSLSVARVSELTGQTAREIGTITLDAPSGGSVRLLVDGNAARPSELVDARLAARPVPPVSLAQKNLPEPALLTSLAAGALLAACLHRLRASRA